MYNQWVEVAVSPHDTKVSELSQRCFVSIIGYTDDDQPIVDMFNGGEDNFNNIIRDLGKIRVVNEDNLNKAMESLEKMAEDCPNK